MPETTLPRQLESVALASELVGGYLKERGWSTRDVDRAVLSVGEAASNSVEHGRGPFVLGYALEGDTLTLEVADQGSGPAPALVQRAALPADTFAEGGRGLFILSSLADSISVLEDGRLRITVERTT